MSSVCSCAPVRCACVPAPPGVFEPVRLPACARVSRVCPGSPRCLFTGTDVPRAEQSVPCCAAETLCRMSSDDWPPTRPLVVGAHCIFTGLRSRADLNGTVGNLLASHDDTSVTGPGRWAVKCRNDGQVIKVKAENLKEWPRAEDPVRLVGEPLARADDWGSGSLIGAKGYISGDSTNPATDKHLVVLIGFDTPHHGWVHTSCLRPASPLTPGEVAEAEGGCEYGACGKKEFVKCGGCGYTLCELHEEGRIECEQGDYCPDCDSFVCASCCVALNDEAYGQTMDPITTLGQYDQSGSDEEEAGRSFCGDGRLRCGKCNPTGWPKGPHRFANDRD